MRDGGGAGKFGEAGAWFGHMQAGRAARRGTSRSRRCRHFAMEAKTGKGRRAAADGAETLGR